MHPFTARNTKSSNLLRKAREIPPFTTIPANPAYRMDFSEAVIQNVQSTCSTIKSS